MTVIAAGIGAALAAAVIHFRRAGQRALVVACIAVMAVLVVVTAFSRMDSSGEVSSYGVFAFVIVYFALDYRGRKAAEDKAAAEEAAAKAGTAPELPAGDSAPGTPETPSDGPAPGTDMSGDPQNR